MDAHLLSLRELFLLDPEIVFLNHGSFGATPRMVFDRYQEWQRQLERRPVEFLDRRVKTLFEEARAPLADLLRVNPQDLVYFTNPTTALNAVARSLAWRELDPLQPGDEILTTDHEYGALDRTWRYFCRHTGARYVRCKIPLPITSREDFVERFWEAVTPRTRVIFLSHITSPTALMFPVEEICRQARQAGILTIIDGAHAPGQIPLDLGAMDVDLYAGACHKWLMAPKGAAFLYARPENQSWIDPLVVSWGYESEDHFSSGSQYIDYHQWQGTRDIAAFLSVPTAIEFQEDHHWEAVRERCHHLAASARRRINALTGYEPICPESSSWFGQMFTARLPTGVDTLKLKTYLYERHHIEVPIILWSDQPFIRVSIQGYNDQGDVDALLAALETYLDA